MSIALQVAQFSLKKQLHTIPSVSTNWCNYLLSVVQLLMPVTTYFIILWQFILITSNLLYFSWVRLNIAINKIGPVWVAYEPNLAEHLKLNLDHLSNLIRVKSHSLLSWSSTFITACRPEDNDKPQYEHRFSCLWFLHVHLLLVTNQRPVYRQIITFAHPHQQ